jgi:formylmethanofuran dehydrogenase subunit C
MDQQHDKPTERVIDVSGWPIAEIEARLRQQIAEASRAKGASQASEAEWAEGALSLRLVGHPVRQSAFMAWEKSISIVIEGSLADYACAFNRNANFRVEGSVGAGVGEGMVSGAVRVRGDCGVGAGTAMRGGTLAIYGRAGANCGAAMRGGELFVRGDVGPAAAAGALWGTLVIGGDAGPGLGDSMRCTTIFIRGTASALGRGVREAPLREREKLRLGLLLINAGIRGDVKDFRRIVSEVTLQEEVNRPRGEVDPSWR